MSNVDTEFKQKNRCQCLTRTEEKSMRKRIAMVLLGLSLAVGTPAATNMFPTVSAQTVQAAGKTGWTQESGTWYFYKDGVKQIRLEIRQKEYDGESHNVIAELPGKREEWIVLSAHYDTTSLSHGAYDNMSGCAGLLGIMEQMKGKELNYGLRFVFCGSEERGLLGSKAYVRDHEKELRQTVLNINLDMIGTYMGKFIACVSAEEKLTHYISYMAAEVGFPIAAENGVYSSDSTPFADHGVPAVSFARIANGNVAPIHCRYDVKDVMSMEQLQKDIDFLTVFTGRFANAAVCPVAREIPETIRKQLDEYLFRKRKEA